MDILFAFPIILLAIGIVAAAGSRRARQHGDRHRCGVCADLRANTCVRRALLPAGGRLYRRGANLRVNRGVHSAAAFSAQPVGDHSGPGQPSLSTAILVEASLSFLGLGDGAADALAGAMLAESRNFLSLSPWVAVFSGAAILLASLGFNLLGDGVQDRLDPRFRGV